MTAETLAQDEVQDRLRDLPGWSLRDGKVTRTYHLGSHFAAAAMTVHVAQIQDEINHHSDLTLGYDSVAISVCTHAAGGAITENDIALARRIEAIAPGHGAN